MPAPTAPPGEGRANSFDALRLFGAAAVLVDHSFALTGRHGPVVGGTPGGTALGTLGVLMFFGISGFLITQSWLRAPRFWTFAAKRALRLLPALVLVVFVTALVMGPLVTTLSATHYFGSMTTWKYVVGNVVLKTEFFLPGVFKSNPAGSGINGSLWTLPIEAHAYIIVAILGLATVLRRRLVAVGAFVAVVAIATRFPNGVYGVGDPDFLAAFAWGATLYLWRDTVTWNGGVAVTLLLVAVALSDTSSATLLMAIALPYTAVFVAYRLPTLGQAVTKRGDYSYGLYVWAFPTQELIAHLWHSVSPGEMILLATPAAFLMSVVSWHLVEHRALQLKQRLPVARLEGALPIPAAQLVVVESQESTTQGSTEPWPGET